MTSNFDPVPVMMPWAVAAIVTLTVPDGVFAGMEMESPRGPISIDPQERDIVQNIYIRKTERVDGELYNVEFETLPAVKDPGK